MLSFMREQSAGDVPSGSGAEARPGHEDGQEYLTVAANSKSLRRSSILVLVLVAAGLAGLAYMIRQSQPQAASAEPVADETQIEVAISRLTGVSAEMVSRMDEIVKRFYEFSDVFQVEVGELVKDPFEVEMFAEALKEDPGKVEDDRAQQAVLRRQRLEQRAAALKLLSVMRSDEGNCCMINDRILRQGDTIEGFTITAINGDSVELAESGRMEEAEALRFQLKLTQ